MRHARRIGSVVTIAVLAASAASGDEPGRELTATARMSTSQGSRSMPITLLVSRYTPIEEARYLAELLASGGQGAVLANLRGRADGQLRLGAVEFSISLAVAEPASDGYRYLFVTARRIRVEEADLMAESLDYPFGVAVFELGDFGRGRGEIYPEAALAIGDDGRVEVEQYQSDPGELTDIKRVR
jgi:hypothetical protein